MNVFIEYVGHNAGRDFNDLGHLEICYFYATENIKKKENLAENLCVPFFGKIYVVERVI